MTRSEIYELGCDHGRNRDQTIEQQEYFSKLIKDSPPMTFLYLGSPYSHPDPEVREQRYQAVLAAMARIAGFKIPVYCPIAVWHPVSSAHSLPGDHEFWWVQDEAFVQSCTMAWFLKIPGLEESKGCQNERLHLEKLKKTIWTVQPEDLDRICRYFLSKGGFSA